MESMAPFTLLRFCYDAFLLHQSYPFTLLRFCTKRREKQSFLSVHIDQMRFQKPPFLWISTFDSVFVNLRFCDVFVRLSVNTFTKTEVFLSVFVQKRSSVNGAWQIRTMFANATYKNRPAVIANANCFPSSE